MNTKTEDVLKKLNKRHGQGSVGILDQMKFGTYERTPTGSLGLDIATGGGWPVGRIIELLGWESSGKTTICKHAIAEAQKAIPDRLCAFIDTEHAFDKKYAQALGVDTDRLLVAQPMSGEEAFDIAVELIRAGEISMLVFDSLAGARPKAQVEGEVGESGGLGLHARLNSEELPKLAGSASKNKTTVFITNQLRYKIGGYGNPEIGTGGNALKFYTSLRVEQSRSVSKDNKIIGEGGEVEGNLFKSRVVKNKTAPPFREAVYDILYGVGVDTVGEIFDYAVASGLINQSGTWYSLPDDGMKLGQGRANVISLLRDNDELAQELLLGIKQAYGIQ